MSTDAGKGKDRRRHFRFPITVGLRYAARQYGSNVPPDLWEGLLINISRSGAAIKVAHKLRRGGLLEISFIQYNPLRSVSVTGKVIRCEALQGLHALTPDGTARKCNFVAVEFSRLLSIDELAMLRNEDALDATAVNADRPSQAGQ